MKKILVFLIVFMHIDVLALGYGDINNDGKISSTDYVMMRKYIMKSISFTEDQIKSADINKDNKVNSLDYIAIRKKILAGDKTPETIPGGVTPIPTISPTITPTPASSTISVTGLNLESNQKVVLKVGQSEIVKVSVTPTNATNKKINYINSNSTLLSIDNGKITGLREGSGTITIKTDDGKYQKEISYIVNPKTGVINGDGGVWQYKSPQDVTPVRADIDFFKKLANSGKGSLNGNVYTYSDSKNSYKYDISKSVLTVDKNESQMRIYYPENRDLSTLNTFTFFGGTGPSTVNFGEYLGHLDKNPDELSSSGIIILVSHNIGSRYEADDAIIATEFVKSIVGQKSGVKNAMGGYSGSGQEAGKAANKGNYDRLIICNAGFSADLTTNLVNKEIVIFSPVNDKMSSQTGTALNNMRIKGYTNVTVISNSKMSENSSYYSNFLMINPGSQMGNGHGYSNISKARIFSYECR